MAPVTVNAPDTLLPFLFASWPEAKKTTVRQWLKFGAVQVNDQVVTQFNHALKTGDVVAIRPGKKPSPGLELLPEGLKVVFEDEAILVVEKPAGLLTVASETERETTVYACLTDYIRAAPGKGRNRLWIVHRLDRETSGLLILAKTEEVKEALQGNWTAVEKHYMAVVEGVPPKKEDLLISFLDESQPHKVFASVPGPETREARTHYRTLKSGVGRTLLDVKLDTGRRHQIRVQLSSVGCPIVGDEKYGAKTNPARRVALHASKLQLAHPLTQAALEFELPLPDALASLVGWKSSSKSRR